MLSSAKDFVVISIVQFGFSYSGFIWIDKIMQSYQLMSTLQRQRIYQYIVKT